MTHRVARLLCHVTLIGSIAGRTSAQGTFAAPDNPEALLNQARVYADRGDLDSAISTYERSLTIIDGPRAAGIPDATVVKWKALEPVAKLNLAILYAARGIDFFQADDLDGAISAFRTSLQWNGYSRDIRYNLAQALYIKASRLKEQGQATTKLTALYNDILAEAVRVHELDPGNANLLLILGYTYRNLGDETRAAAFFAENANFPFEVHDIRMAVGTTDTLLSGVVKNLKLKEGDPVGLRITLLALDGGAAGTSDVQVAAPAASQGTSFGVNIKTTEDVAGWRYEVR